MIRENIEAIIFDFGGVIINIDYQKTIDSFKQMGITNFDELYSQANQSSLFDDIETGKISGQRFINGILDYLPAGTSPNQVVQAWNAMLLDIPVERIELLQELGKNYRIFMLSNTNEIHIASALRQWDRISDHGIHSVFEKVYLSHEIGMRKPDREIFEHVCTEQGLNPSTTLFIDDSHQHILGAQEAGLQTEFLEAPKTIHELFS